MRNGTRNRNRNRTRRPRNDNPWRADTGTSWITDPMLICRTIAKAEALAAAKRFTPISVSTAAIAATLILAQREDEASLSIS